MELKRSFTALGISLVLAMMLNTGCQSDKVLPPVIEEEISYANDMQPFFDASCSTTGCHDGTGIPLNLLADVSYDEIISGDYVNLDEPSLSVLYVRIHSGNMATYATDNERAMTLAWITQGAKNN